jgi:hypothetical protein
MTTPPARVAMVISCRRSITTEMVLTSIASPARKNIAVTIAIHRGALPADVDAAMAHHLGISTQ